LRWRVLPPARGKMKIKIHKKNVFLRHSER
jgi:hypothetical protein